MDRATLQRILQQIIEEERGEPLPSLDEKLQLRDQLGLDSVDLISLVMRLQQRLEIVLTDEELRQVVSVGDLLNVLQARLKGSGLGKQVA